MRREERRMVLEIQLRKGDGILYRLTGDLIPISIEVVRGFTVRR